MSEAIEWMRRRELLQRIGVVELPDLQPVNGRRRLWQWTLGAILLFEEGGHPASPLATITSQGARFHRDYALTHAEILACVNVAAQIAEIEARNPREDDEL